MFLFRKFFIQARALFYRSKSSHIVMAFYSLSLHFTVALMTPQLFILCVCFYSAQPTEKHAKTHIKRQTIKEEKTIKLNFVEQKTNSIEFELFCFVWCCFVFSLASAQTNQSKQMTIVSFALISSDTITIEMI